MRNIKKKSTDNGNETMIIFILSLIILYKKNVIVLWINATNGRRIIDVLSTSGSDVRFPITNGCVDQLLIELRRPSLFMNSGYVYSTSGPLLCRIEYFYGNRFNVSCLYAGNIARLMCGIPNNKKYNITYVFIVIVVSWNWWHLNEN